MIQIPRIGQEVLWISKTATRIYRLSWGAPTTRHHAAVGATGHGVSKRDIQPSLYGGPTNGNMLRFDDKTGAKK